MPGPRLAGSLQFEYLGWAAELKMLSAAIILSPKNDILVFIIYFNRGGSLFFGFDVGCHVCSFLGSDLDARRHGAAVYNQRIVQHGPADRVTDWIIVIERG